MISLEKLMILAPLQKLPNNVGDLGKIIVATGFKWLPKVQQSPNLITLLVTLVTAIRFGESGKKLATLKDENCNKISFCICIAHILLNITWAIASSTCHSLTEGQILSNLQYTQCD